MTTFDAVQFVEVSPPYHGQRIDNFLLRTLKGVPKSMIYRILRKGEVRVNRGRIRPEYRLQTGDVVRIPPLRVSEDKGEVRIPPAVLERINQAILLEDKKILVLNKPAGVAVHKGSGLDFGIIEALRALRPDAPYLELAHRLDRETSGCLVLAKTPAALRTIQAAFHAGTIDKRYLALLRGHWNEGRREVSVPLRKNVLRGGERMVEVVEDGKPALSTFRPVNLFSRASLMEVGIGTGRTHQIRVHAAHIGYPVAGDEKYGDSRFNRQMIDYGLRRLFLHARSIDFYLDGHEVSVSAPLTDELKRVLERLEASR